jgi:hypothetical protein
MRIRLIIASLFGLLELSGVGKATADTFAERLRALEGMRSVSVDDWKFQSLRHPAGRVAGTG